jgi:hypothetical protein
VAFGKARVRFLIEVVPVAAPIVRLVAVVSKLKVVEEEVISPPFIAISPEEVIFPEVPAILKLVAVMSFVPNDSAFTISGSERSMALVIAPAADWILIALANGSSESRFSNNINCPGGAELLPSAKEKYE